MIEWWWLIPAFVAGLFGGVGLFMLFLTYVEV